MNKGFVSIGLIFIAFSSVLLLTEMNLIKEKELTQGISLINSFNFSSLKRTELEELIDSNIEEAIIESVKQNIFSSELIKHRISEKIFNEINKTELNCFIGKQKISIELIELNSVVLVQLFQGNYLIEFNYFGQELECIIESGKINSKIKIPQGFTLIKGGLIAIN